MPKRILILACFALSACAYHVRDLAEIDSCDQSDGECAITTGHDDDHAHDDGAGGDPVLGDGSDPGGDGDGDPWADGDGPDGTDPGDPQGSDPNPCDASTCAPCGPGTARPASIATDCCPACIATDSGCTEPPRQCTTDADCLSTDTCVQGFCGQYNSTGGITLASGQTCQPTSCWSTFDHYDSTCCPSCTIACGTAGACSPDSCTGFGCNCTATGGVECLAVECACAY